MLWANGTNNKVKYDENEDFYLKRHQLADDVRTY